MALGKIRHQLFLTEQLSERLEAVAAQPGVTKSAVLEDALAAWLIRRGTSELEDRFALRLDRMSQQLARIERNSHVLIETLALFVRYMLAAVAPLADGDDVGRASAQDRFKAFVTRVGRQLASGKRSFSNENEQ